tara:strand:- start:1557 stop:1787 length:231 start_codon:yes stop_codon:yes gene_type:complete
MGKNEKTPISIENIDYNFEDLTEEQQRMINHVVDLDRKLNSARFNLDQLQEGRNAFFNKLKASLENKDESGVKDSG